MATIDGYLEVGTKRTFAGAFEWPGWCRSGRDGDAALERLVAYGERYGKVVEPFGLGFRPPAGVGGVAIRERLSGDSTTDFGAPSGAPSVDLVPIAPEDDDADRLATILRAAWSTLEQVVEVADARELAKGPRGGGRSVEGIVAHVVGAEAAYQSAIGRKLRVAEDEPLARTADRVLDELGAAIRDGVPPSPRGGKRWTVRYYVRRAAWHVLDHAWEIEDRLP